ncbi:MAG: hypothetical protein ACTSQQ_16410, partial [Candidatus Helarchaeota archaeon]
MQMFAYWATISGYLLSIGVFSAIFIVLIQKWNRASTKYYSDLPFILALAFVFLIYDRIDSILGLSGIMSITTLSQLINLLAFISFNGIILFILLIIWLPEKKTTRNITMIIWAITWITIISVFMSIIGTPETLHSVIFLISFPMLILFTVTFYFCHFQ